MFSKTTDGGVTWSNGRAIFDPGEKNQTIGNQIVVPTAGPAKGMLIDGFDLIQNKGGLGNNQRAGAVRRGDPLDRWRRDLVAADHRRPAGLRERQHRRARGAKQRRAAGVRGRTQRQPLRRLAGRALQREWHLEGGLLKSTDGGLTWSTPIRVDQSRRRHAGIHATGARRLRRHGRSQLLRPRERDDRSARADRHVHRALSRRLHQPRELGGRWRDEGRARPGRST